MKTLGFGMLRLKQTETRDWGSAIDLETFANLADQYLNSGYNYFDTAFTYQDGLNEQAFREVVAKRYPRDAYMIADKIPVYMLDQPSQLVSVFSKMLENCGVSWFDYLLLHAMSIPAYELSKRSNAFAFLQKQKKEGRAKKVGFSFHGTADALDLILTEHPEVDFVQIQINYLDWEDVTIQSKGCYEVCEKHGKPVIVMEPIKGGSLVDIPDEAMALLKKADPDQSAASWALRFAASHENVKIVLSGMKCEEDLRDNLKTFRDLKPITKEEYAVLQKAADIIHAQTAINCTGCRYCIPGCPKQIVISDYFSIYNTYKRSGLACVTDIWNYYNNLAKIHGGPTDCIKCGKCEERCPQHLPIRELLQTVQEELKDL